MKNALPKILLGVFIFITSNMFSQNVSGTVTTNTGPIVGASVVVKGTNKSTQTDFDGNYSINGIDSNSILVFSYIGFKQKEILVGNQSKINPILEESIETLQDVVIIGYGQSQSKRTLSSAISSVSSKHIESLPVSRVENLLQGAAAGVVVQQNSGAPGAESTIRIRGVGSAQNSDPLYIVDGFPVPNLQHLNPSDIKELVVLKDAASTAVYGSRGSNGVILVKTKMGRKNSKTLIAINGYSGVQYMGFKPNLMNASEYINYYNQGVAEAGGSLNGNRGAFSEAERNSLANTDWYNAVSKPATISSSDVSLSGGGEKFTFSLSGGMFDQDGIFSRDGKSNYNRKNLSASFNVDVRDNLQISATASVAKMVNYQMVGGVGDLNSLPSIYPTYAENGEVFNPGRQNPKPSFNGVPLNVMGAMTNPLWALNGFQGNESINDVINYGIAADWKPISDLNVRVSYNYYKNNGLYRAFTPSLGAIYPTQNFFLVGSYTESPSGFVNNQVTSTATYTFSKLAPKGHNLDVLLGYEVVEGKYNYGGNITNVDDFLTYNFDDANFALASNPLKAVFTPSKITERGLVSYISRLKYNFKEKYLATASIRNDRSSTFGSNFKSGYFPSFSLGWVLSNENFLKESKFINVLKLRSSWGISGTDATQGYAYLSTINSNVNYAGVPGLTLTGLANPDLKWEELAQFNVGLDLTAFNNLDISVDYYKKMTTDVLLLANTPASSGLNPSLVNVGGVDNSGLEFAISYKKVSEKFSWNASFNLGYNENKVTGLGNNGQPLEGGFTGALFSDPITLTAIGKPIGSFYGYQVEGMDANKNLLFKDLDGSGNDRRNPNPGDKTFIGKPLPDFNAGLNLGASFSGFDFSAFFFGASGNDVFDATIAYTAIGSNRPASYLQDGAPRNLVVAAPGDSNGENLVSDFHVKDASFIKLKNVVIGYSLPKNFVSKLNADKIRFYISGQNLFTLTKYQGVDPEVGGSILSSGIDTGFYPQSRSYLLGFQFNF
ncbi:SusC/RagA family TonB-linked outer membrane protein [Flavobacterium sp.]|uniref:SusC/RagA family TonB-linked outer membrane protein n=1 Tax=Flavobacterium sp. TaxID=239 RepID=UPI00286DE25A|nr:SusC/RagA family TonB-linked outer membrane protein [Flavobacterium sp.]